MHSSKDAWHYPPLKKLPVLQRKAEKETARSLISFFPKAEAPRGGTPFVEGPLRESDALASPPDFRGILMLTLNTRVDSGFGNRTSTSKTGSEASIEC